MNSRCMASAIPKAYLCFFVPVNDGLKPRSALPPLSLKTILEYLRMRVLLMLSIGSRPKAPVAEGVSVVSTGGTDGDWFPRGAGA